MILLVAIFLMKVVLKTIKFQSIKKKLQSHYGKFAVLGDKDQNDSSTCSNILTEAGFEVLHNEVRNIYYKRRYYSINWFRKYRRLFWFD